MLQCSMNFRGLASGFSRPVPQVLAERFLFLSFHTAAPLLRRTEGFHRDEP
jgi:hypothetical protein